MKSVTALKRAIVQVKPIVGQSDGLLELENNRQFFGSGGGWTDDLFLITPESPNCEYIEVQVDARSEFSRTRTFHFYRIVELEYET